jgi:drug/metabolite transporter (DMT)-like permease
LAPGLALAVVGSIAFSGKAIIVKLAYRHGVDAVTLLMYRMLFALPFFAAMAWWAGRGKPALTRRDALGVLWLGVTGLLPGQLSRLCRAAVHHRVTRAADPVPQSHAGAAAGLAAARRRIRRPQTVAMAVSYSGVVLVFGHQLSLDGTAVAWGARCWCS